MTYLAAQFRCKKLASKAMEIWVDPADPAHIYSFDYSCWESREEADVTPMPACTMTEAAQAEYMTYTHVDAVCGDANPIQADCMMIIAGTTGTVFLMAVVGPLCVLFAAYAYTHTHKKKHEALQLEMMEEETKGRRLGKKDRERKAAKDKKQVNHSKAAGKYDDVRGMWAQDDMF